MVGLTRSPTAKKTIWLCATLLACSVLFLFAQAPGTVEGNHAPMEILGMGPEMFQNRLSAWIKSGGQICRDFVAEFGLVALAAVGLYKTLSRSVLDAMTDRLDRQREDIEKNKDKLMDVALSIPPPGMAIGTPTNPAIIAPAPGETLPVTETPATDT